MCDYSLHLVASRPAVVGDKLVSTDFARSITRGSGSMNIITLHPSAFIAVIAAAGEACVASSFQPSSEVNAVGASGTKVTCSGTVSRTICMNRSSG